MRILKINFFVILLLAKSGNVVSQEQASSNDLSLDWLSQEIIEENVELDAIQLRLKAKQALIESADALDDPRISYSLAPFSIGDEIPSDLGNALGFRSVIQISQNIPWPGKLRLRSELAVSEAELLEYSRDELLLRLINEGRRLWASLWYLEHALTINAEHRDLLTELEAITTTQYANGIGLQQDLLQVQTELITNRQRTTELMQEKRRLQAALNALLDKDANSVMGDADEVIAVPALPEQQVIWTWIIEENPSLLSQRSQSEMALTRLELEEKNDFPDIQMSMGYTEIMNDSSLRFQVGASVNIPFDFGNRRARKAAASYEYSSSISDVEYLRNELDSALERLLSSYQELTGNLDLLTLELLPTAEQTFNAASANYEGGGGNFSSLVVAQRQLLDIQLQLSWMQSQEIQILSEIDKLSGGKLWPVEER